jgi:hypothetical protein
LINLCARHRNDLVESGSSGGVFFYGLFSANTTIWFLIDVFQWPVEKTHTVIWDALQDYGRIEWQQTLSDLEKALDFTNLMQYGESKILL